MQDSKSHPSPRDDNGDDTGRRKKHSSRKKKEKQETPAPEESTLITEVSGSKVATDEAPEKKKHHHRKREKKEEPPQPSETEILEGDIDKLLNDGENPPPEKLEDVLAFARRRQIETMMKEDFYEARKYKWAEDLLQKAINEEKQRQDNSEYIHSIDERIGALEQRIEATQSEYDEKIREYDTSVEARRQELQSKHAQEEQQFEEAWAKPESLAMFNRASPQLIQLRQIMKIQALSKDFDSAMHTKSIAENMQRQEEEESQKRAVSAMRAAYSQMRERQEKEMAFAQQNWDRHRVEIEAKRDRAIKADELAIRQLEQRKSTPGPKRIRVGGALLTLPETPAGSASLAVSRGTTSPRTRKRMIQYRTGNNVIKLNLHGLNVRECISPVRAQQPFRPRTTKRYRAYQ